MPYYRVTWEGYLEGEFDDEEQAKKALIENIEENEIDAYGRDWRELIVVENLGSDEKE